ncbi:MAG: hypothetical protein JRF38_10055 [Deltaproteobacteria bacterium]|jgi:hypothetical protein|nr:hypothetical protein [Deltaproteobacteria bacterium]
MASPVVNDWYYFVRFLLLYLAAADLILSISDYGVMEWWNIGVVQTDIHLVSITPVPQYSNTPIATSIENQPVDLTGFQSALVT